MTRLEEAANAGSDQEEDEEAKAEKSKCTSIDSSCKLICFSFSLW